MSDLPDGWEWTTLGELGAGGLFIDGDWVESKDQNPNGEVRLTQLADVGEGLFRDRSDRSLTMEKATELRCTFLCENDLLIARMPDPLGRACLYPGSSRPAVTVVDVAVLRPDSQVVEPRWLVWVINSPQVRQEIARYQTGSTRKRISRKNLASVSIPLPPLAEQRRIVAALEGYLSRLDAGVRGLGAAKARSLSWLAAARQDAVLGGQDEAHLPQGWRIGSLRDVLQRVEAGKSFAAEGRPAKADEWGILKVSAMTWGEFRSGENKAVLDPAKIDKRYEVLEGDVLVSRANTREYVGAPVLVGKHHERLLLSDKSLRLIPGEGVSRDWLLSVLSSPYVRRLISASATGTKDSMRNISQSSLLDVRIPLPPTDARARVAELSGEASDQHGRLGEAIHDASGRAERLRRSLLREAFAGRLVEQDPVDEHASALLERIRQERESAPQTKRGRKAKKAGGDGASASPVIDSGRPLPESVGRATQGSLDLGL